MDAQDKADKNTEKDTDTAEAPASLIDGNDDEQDVVTDASFGDGFDEAAAKDTPAVKPPKSATKKTAAKKQPAMPAAAEDAEPEQEDEDATGEEGQAEPREDPTTEQQTADAAAKAEPKPTAEEASANERAEQEYERQMAERGTPVKKPVPAPVKPPETEKPAAPVAPAAEPQQGFVLPSKFKLGDVEVDLEEVKRDFPEAAAYAEAIKVAAEQAIAKQHDELVALRYHVLQQQQQVELAEFRRAIESKHPGAIELVRTAPFQEWMKSQKDSTKFLFEQGGEPGADAVLALYTVHTSRTAAAVHDTKAKAKLDRQQQLHSGTVHSPSTVKTGKTRKPQEDFDDGFDLAASDDRR